MTIDYHHNPRTEMLLLAPTEVKTALDIGCAAGLFARSLMDRNGAEVWGVEPDNNAAREAGERLYRVINSTIEDAIDKLPDTYFDLIVANDVLEHLVDPEVCLKRLLPKLKADGQFLCSVPNVRYYKHLRELIVHGDWEYREEGILDRTHLRFFTIKSLAAMMRRLNCEIITLKCINGRKRLWLKLLNLIFLSKFQDIPFMQIACLVKPVTANTHGPLGGALVQSPIEHVQHTGMP